MAKTTEELVNGPDQLCPATELTTTAPDGAVTFRSPVEGGGNLAPISVPTMLRKAAEEAPDKMALSVKRKGEWLSWNYRQYYKDSR